MCRRCKQISDVSRVCVCFALLLDLLNAALKNFWAASCVIKWGFCTMGPASNMWTEVCSWESWMAVLVIVSCWCWFRSWLSAALFFCFSSSLSLYRPWVLRMILQSASFVWVGFLSLFVFVVYCNFKLWGILWNIICRQQSYKYSEVG